MKAKVKSYADLTSDNNSDSDVSGPIEGEIEFELDEEYWRNEFAKSALNMAHILLKMYREENPDENCPLTEWLPKICFEFADKMVEETKKRNARLNKNDKTRN